MKLIQRHSFQNRRSKKIFHRLFHRKFFKMYAARKPVIISTQVRLVLPYCAFVYRSEVANKIISLLPAQALANYGSDNITKGVDTAILGHSQISDTFSN